MRDEHINFYVLGHKAGGRIRVLEWAPVEVRLAPSRKHDINTKIGWWGGDLEDDLYYVRTQLPDGLFAAYVNAWASQGMEDCDEGARLLAVTPVDSMAWRHTWGSLRTQAEEAEHADRKAQAAHYREMEARMIAELTCNP